jgi:putative membrane protein
MEQIYYDLKPIVMLGTLIYSIIGLLIFSVAFYIMVKIAPFSVRKEIEEDQNTSLAILMGSVFIALAIIIQAAIRG